MKRTQSARRSSRKPSAKRAAAPQPNPEADDPAIVAVDALKKAWLRVEDEHGDRPVYPRHARAALHKLATAAAAAHPATVEGLRAQLQLLEGKFGAELDERQAVRVAWRVDDFLKQVVQVGGVMVAFG